MKKKKSLLDDQGTVGQLLDFIEKHNLSRDSKIYLQRVEDSYFTERVWHDGTILSAWETIKKCGLFCGQVLKFNKDLEAGKYNDKEKYPNMFAENKKKYTEEDLDGFKEEYYSCWSPVKYPDDENLYLDAHY